MKKFITLIFLTVSTNLFAQDWADKIAKRFYSIVDPSKKLECCDKTSNAISIDYTHKNYEMPYQSVDEAFSQYYVTVMDSLTIETIVHNLVDSYNRIPEKFKKDFDKGCFNIETKTQVSQGYQSELYFVEGNVHFTFSFQTKKPLKVNWFRKKFGIF